MTSAEEASARERLRGVEERLRPQVAHEHAASELDDMFRAGSVPDPAPNGFLQGRALMMSASGAADMVGRRLGDLYMPWRGKSFNASTHEGVNIVAKSARLPLKALWPSYEPERELADRLEVFPFRTLVGPGEIDRDVRVLKIDYDFERNPSFIIRNILDELVQIEDGLYLGKILYRWKGSHKPAGFFSLQV